MTVELDVALNELKIDVNNGSGQVDINGVLTAGNQTTGDKSQVESDGTVKFEGEAVVWDDLKEAAIARNLDTTSGRIDYNYAEATVDFADNARYADTEQLTMAMQMSHSYKFGSNMMPHVHWFQEYNAIPNWLMEYRIVENGEVVSPTFLKAVCSDQVFTYTSGKILQICRFPTITGVSTISFSVDVKIYRDTGNTSGLFAGADPYTGTASLKFFDIHYQKDTGGSRGEYTK